MFGNASWWRRQWRRTERRGEAREQFLHEQGRWSRRAEQCVAVWRAFLFCSSVSHSARKDDDFVCCCLCCRLFLTLQQLEMFALLPRTAARRFVSLLRSPLASRASHAALLYQTPPLVHRSSRTFASIVRLFATFFVFFFLTADRLSSVTNVFRRCKRVSSRPSAISSRRQASSTMRKPNARRSRLPKPLMSRFNVLTMM